MKLRTLIIAASSVAMLVGGNAMANQVVVKGAEKVLKSAGKAIPGIGTKIKPGKRPSSGARKSLSTKNTKFKAYKSSQKFKTNSRISGYAVPTSASAASMKTKVEQMVNDKELDLKNPQQVMDTLDAAVRAGKLMRTDAAYGEGLLACLTLKEYSVQARRNALTALLAGSEEAIEFNGSYLDRRSAFLRGFADALAEETQTSKPAATCNVAKLATSRENGGCGIINEQLKGLADKACRNTSIN